MADRRMSLMGHLAELRRRLLIILAALGVGMILVWIKVTPLMDFLLAPLGRPVIYTSPMGGLVAVSKVALWGGAVLASPVILWQVLGFVMPALKPRERRLTLGALATGLGAFAGGAAFAWRYVVPRMLSLGLEFSSDRMQAFVTTDEYFRFVFLVVGSVGLAFELPVVTAALARLGVLSWRAILKRWRIGIFACFVLAAVLTPSPDPVDMLIMAVPFCGLFFAGVASAWMFAPRPAAGRGR